MALPVSLWPCGMQHSAPTSPCWNYRMTASGNPLCIGCHFLSQHRRGFTKQIWESVVYPISLRPNFNPTLNSIIWNWEWASFCTILTCEHVSSPLKRFPNLLWQKRLQFLPNNLTVLFMKSVHTARIPVVPELTYALHEPAKQTHFWTQGIKGWAVDNMQHSIICSHCDNFFFFCF